MPGLVLFIISFLLVLVSSYFLASMVKSNKFENSIIYLVLILISQVILSFEILSIFRLINPAGVLVCNTIMFVVSAVLWKRNNAPGIDFSGIRIIKTDILRALRKDKVLFILSVLFVYASLISLFFVLSVPTNSWDSMNYHLARIGFWIQNGTLAHFETSMIRQVIYSINSEILMLWSMVFLKRDFLILFLQYFAYLGSIFLIYTTLRYFRVTIRRSLWCVFLFASLPAVIIESSSAQTNLFVGFLLFCSFYLFVYGVRERDLTAVVFSALAFSLDIGVKYSGFFFVPIFGVIYLLISYREMGKGFYKPILTFILASIPCFIFFSAYNHILNFIDFGNPFGPGFYIDKLNYTLSFKGFWANMIRYFWVMIDFAGIPAAKGLNYIYLHLKDLLFYIFSLKSSDGLVFNEIKELNTFAHENHAKLGLLGFIVFIPLIFRYSFKKIIFSSTKSFYIALTGLFTVGFIASMSILMGFCYWNNRFLLSAFVLSIPIFAFSYSRRLNFLKGIISGIAIFNLLVIPVSITSKPLLPVINILSSRNFTEARNEIRLRDEIYFKYNIPYYSLYKYLGLVVSDNSKIGLIFNDDDWYYPFFEENPSWKVYPLRYEILYKKKNHSDYDYLVFVGETQDIDVISKKITFSYKIKGKDLIYNKTQAGEPVILYINTELDPVTSGKIFYQRNVIDFSLIPKNFKLAQKITVIEKYRHLGLDLDRTFFIYKKQ